jgi:hypothetical protein
MIGVRLAKLQSGQCNYAGLTPNISIIANTFAFFGQYPVPGNFTYAPAIGFLLTLCWFQIRTKNLALNKK